MDERLKFVARLLDGEKMAALCREFGISRKTGYKLFNRYKDSGLEGLSDQSRRPYRRANQLPFQVERTIHGRNKLDGLLPRVVAAEDETGFFVGYGIAQTTDGVNNARLRRAHGQHLADTARFETRRHQEEIAAPVEWIGERFRVTTQE